MFVALSVWIPILINHTVHSMNVGRYIKHMIVCSLWFDKYVYNSSWVWGTLIVIRDLPNGWDDFSWSLEWDWLC